jgi:hypothetical protein
MLPTRYTTIYEFVILQEINSPIFITKFK